LVTRREKNHEKAFRDLGYRIMWDKSNSGVILQSI